MGSSLKTIFEKHQGKLTDRWELYINEYDRLYSHFRKDPVSLLEIGIQNGGSLEIWAKYFLNGRIFIGCDIDPKCAELVFDDPRISVVAGDASTTDIERNILERSPAFDIIIDDGSHRSGDIIRSFGKYFPHLNDGGMYLVEDLHCSYWEKFEGGLTNPYSSIAFFKSLADGINFEHWKDSQTLERYLTRFSERYQTWFSEHILAHIHSIEFVNSLCVIKKSAPVNNLLGKRAVFGNDETVTDGWKGHDQSTSHDLAVELQTQPSQPAHEEGQPNTEPLPLWDDLPFRLSPTRNEEPTLHPGSLPTQTAISNYRYSKFYKLNRLISTVLNIGIVIRERFRFYSAIGQPMRLFTSPPVFDEDWYLEQYPDVALGGFDPFSHYMHYGWKEGRNPNWMFDVNWYLEQYQDVIEDDQEPLLHYLTVGWTLGYDPSERFSTLTYVSNHEGKLGGMNPLEHYLVNGATYHKDNELSARNTSDHSLGKEKDIPNAARLNLGLTNDHPVASSPGGTRENLINDALFEEDDPLFYESSSTRLIAFYQPQIHAGTYYDPQLQADEVHWTRIASAKPCFTGHGQPQIPGVLGFYDQMIPDVLEQQVSMAQKHGVFGFCFPITGTKKYPWQGARHAVLIETVAFPYCLKWKITQYSIQSGIDPVITQSEYLQNRSRIIEDFFRDHLLPALSDTRYIRMDSKPLLLLETTPSAAILTSDLNQLRNIAIKEGLGEIYLSLLDNGLASKDFPPTEIDSIVEFPPYSYFQDLEDSNNSFELNEREFQGHIFQYPDLVRSSLARVLPDHKLHRTVVPKFDNTPSAEAPEIFIRESPSLYQYWLEELIDEAAKRHKPAERAVFINSWNNWGTGAFLEPDGIYGFAYLNATVRAQVNTQSIYNHHQRQLTIRGEETQEMGREFSVEPESTQGGNPTPQHMVKMIAFYLPQVNQPPQDLDPGIREEEYAVWAQVAKAKKIFLGHDQPRTPAEFGFYDFREQGMIRGQIELAKRFGIEGFCFHNPMTENDIWHKTIDRFLIESNASFPFCIFLSHDRYLHASPKENGKPGRRPKNPLSPYLFNLLAMDSYLKSSGRPVILVAVDGDDAFTEKEIRIAIQQCVDKGFEAPCLIGVKTRQYGNVQKGVKQLLDAEMHLHSGDNTAYGKNIKKQILIPQFRGNILPYRDLQKQILNFDEQGLQPVFAVAAGWDDTPLGPVNSHVLSDASPDLYQRWLENAGHLSVSLQTSIDNFIFLQSWNDWVRGAIIEPDSKYGDKFLKATFQASANLLNIVPLHQSRRDKVKLPPGFRRRSITAVVLHLYYHEMWEEIKRHLSSLVDGFDLFISLPHKPESADDMILNDFPDARIYHCENRGRDVLSFLEIFSTIYPLNYRYICKIHTKKSPHISGGNTWRNDLLHGLLGTPKIIDNIHDVFNRAPDVGVIAPRKYVISSLEQDFMEHNYAKVIDLARRGNIHYEKGDAFTYCAGTMFWFRPQALALINSINISPSEFETEKGQLTSTYAHAFERFIGLVVQEAGYKISSVG